MKKLLVAALLAGATAYPGAVALADHCTANTPPDPPSTDCDAIHVCDFNTVAQETATGGQDTFTGEAHGYVFSPKQGQAVSVRCYVTVNDAEVATTPTGTGTNAATTAGQVSYTATDAEIVKLCVEWHGASTGAGTATECFGTTTTTFPPAPVTDAIDDVFELLIAVAEDVDAVIAQVFDIVNPLLEQFVDGTLCTVLKLAAPGIPGVLDIDPADGDTDLLGEPFWLCPPYDS